MDLSSVKKIYIIKDQSDLDSIKDHTQEEYIYLAFTEHGIDVLEKMKLSYFTPFDLISNSKELNILEEYYYGSKFTNDIDELLAEKFSYLSQNNGQIINNNFVHMRRLFVEIFNYIDKIIVLLENFPNMKMIYNGESSSPVLDAAFILVKEKFPLRLEVNQLELATFEVSNLSLFTGERPKSSHFKKILRILLKKDYHSSLRSYLKRYFGVYDKNKENILILDSSGIGEDHIREIVESNKYNIYFWDELILNYNEAKEIDLELDQCNEIDKRAIDHDFFLRKGVDTGPYFKKFISTIVSNEYPRFVRYVETFKHFHSKLNFSAIITTYDLPYWGSIVNFCEDKKIPYFHLAHGGTIGIFKNMHTVSLSTKTSRGYHPNLIYLSYSEKINKALELERAHLYKAKARTDVLKFNYFETLYKKSTRRLSSSSKFRICYVISGSFPCNPNIKWASTDDLSLYRLRLKIAKYLKTIDIIEMKSSFEIKSGYDYENLDLNVLSLLKESSVKIVPTTTRLTDIMDSYDCFILEAAGTPLAELATLNKEVIMLNNPNVWELNDESRELLEKKFVICDVLDEFFNTIIDVVECGKEAACFRDTNSNDLSFAKEFLNIQKTSKTNLSSLVGTYLS